MQANPTDLIYFIVRSDRADTWSVFEQGFEQPIAEFEDAVSAEQYAWSLAATGTFNMPPQAALAAFPGRSREVYDAIVQHQGASIYELAQHARVPYRRVHAHVVAMVGKGLVRTRSDTQGARAKRRLYTMG